MLFKKEKWLEDEELGFLKAKTLIFETSSIKWKKRIDFLGFDVDVMVSGTPHNLNKAQRKIIISALNEKKLLEKQVKEVIKGLCNKQSVKFDAWDACYMCSQIYVEKADLYISIDVILNHLTYELELNWF
jgi:transposase